VTQIAHGTNAGYQAHWRSDRRPCQACREAHAKYARWLRAVNRHLGLS
jgi:hypothetical protein